jgi:hypothetical protein
MKNDYESTALVVCLLVIGGIVCTLWFTARAFYAGEHMVHKQAIERGYAEWAVDVNGTTKFVWKSNTK